MRSAIFESADWLNEKRRGKEKKKKKKKKKQEEVRRGGNVGYVIPARDIGVYRKKI